MCMIMNRVKRRRNTLPVNTTYPFLVNTTIHLCSTGDSYGGNAAGGSDAGTPILGCNNNEDAVIVGIISDNIGCGRPDIDAGICNLSGRPSPPCSLDQQ